MAMRPTRALVDARSGTVLLRSIAEAGSSDWRADHTFLQRGYLQALEEHCADQLRFDYALLRDRGRAIAGAVFQSLDLDAEVALPVLHRDFDGGAERSAGRPWVRRFLGALRLRLVICGSAFAAGPYGSWRDPELPAAAHRAWLVEAARQVAARVRAPGVRVVSAFKDVDDAALVDGATDYQPVADDPVMALALDPRWRNLDDYAAALRSRYRREYRRARERGAHLVRRELTAGEILRLAAPIDALHAQVLARARLVPVRKDARTFARLQQLLGPRFSLVGYFDGPRLVAFNTRFTCGADLDSHFFGMDYAVAESLSLYRNLLYDDIADAIAAGHRRVILGRASQEIKSALGAAPMPLHNFIRHDSRLLTRLLAASTRWLAPPAWAPRRPFRD